MFADLFAQEQQQTPRQPMRAVTCIALEPLSCTDSNGEPQARAATFTSLQQPNYLGAVVKAQTMMEPEMEEKGKAEEHSSEQPEQENDTPSDGENVSPVASSQKVSKLMSRLRTKIASLKAMNLTTGDGQHDGELLRETESHMMVRAIAEDSQSRIKSGLCGKVIRE